MREVGGVKLLGKVVTGVRAEGPEGLADEGKKSSVPASSRCRRVEDGKASPSSASPTT
jgi:hypothetical protein